MFVQQVDDFEQHRVSKIDFLYTPIISFFFFKKKNQNTKLEKGNKEMHLI